jgi:hypothetical protein
MAFPIVGGILTYMGAKFGLGVVKSAAITTIHVFIFKIKVAMVGSYLIIIIFIYNRIVDTISTLDGLVNSGNTSSTINWAFQVVASMGIWDAFIDSFNLFSPVLISLFSLLLAKRALVYLDQLRQYVEDMARVKYFM